MTLAVLAGSMRLPIGEIDFKAITKALTIEYTPMGADTALLVHAYKQTRNSLWVPRQYGLSYCKRMGLEYDDKTSLGVEARFPKIPAPREYQVEALDEIEEATSGYYDFIFRARTGWGKTIGACIIASRLGRSTLIVVDQDNLKDQWVASLVEHFGFSREDIGIIQGKTCDYIGKSFTIAMVQTLTRKVFPQEVYAYFGTVIVDEVHIIGAPTFSRILLELPAAYRFGVSATPKRRDTLQKLIEYNLGKVRVYIDDEHESSAVYVAEHETVYSEYANRAPKMGRFLSEIAEDASRNLLIAEAASYLYDTGRDTLVLSDRIEQLVHIKNLSYYLGIPDDEVGVYTGYTLHYAYTKNPTPTRRPHGWEGGTEYTPISLQLISKRSKKPELERVKTQCRIVNATYGKFSKGVDEPRLSGGVDATPRSRSEQEQGRILRKKDGKKKPIWITISDAKSYRSVFALAKRLVDYSKNNSVVSKWNLKEGKTICNAQDLKAEAFVKVTRLKCMQIVTNSAGLNTLLTKTQQTQAVRRRAKDTTTMPVLPARRSLLRTGSSLVARRGK